MKKIFTTLEANIGELGYEDSKPTSFYNKNRSGKIHFQFHNKPTSFTGHKMFKKDPEEYVKIPGMTIPIGVVLQQAFEE